MHVGTSSPSLDFCVALARVVSSRRRRHNFRPHRGQCLNSNKRDDHPPWRRSLFPTSMKVFTRLLFGRRPFKPVLSSPTRRQVMSSASASALLYAASVSGPSLSESVPDDELTKSKAWHVKGGFENPWPSFSMMSVPTILFGMIKRRFTGEGNVPDTTPPTVPVHKPTFLPSRQSPNDKIRATWLGHACYYVEYPSGLRVLFDPVFTDRCSPFSWLGPKRYTEVPCQIEDIPTIDAVVISHNHYDHLSYPTVMSIAKAHPDCHFFVPLGNKKWFSECNLEQCTELDWWEEVDFTLTPKQGFSDDAKETRISQPGDEALKRDPNTIVARISCLPCQHISARTPFDKAKTLWSSWAVTSNNKSVWFGGDTGYRAVPKELDGKDDWAEEYSHLPHCPAFKDIGRLRGPFDLGLIPIGAYTPRWIMATVHANPRDAVEIFRDTQCKRALGIHWGTWVLTEEDVLEPPKLLKKALAHHKIAEEGVFDVCEIGESREV